MNLSIPLKHSVILLRYHLICSYRALARNVAAPLDKKNGADAGDKWREGKPVRVVRNYKGAKHSKYAPEDGNRYDGIYKVFTQKTVMCTCIFNKTRNLL